MRRVSIADRLNSGSRTGTSAAGHEAPAAGHGAPDAGHEGTNGSSVTAAAVGHGETTSPASHVVEAAGHVAGAAPHWTYAGESGQQNWGELTTDYTACVDGSQQSPLNISQTVVTPLVDLRLNYPAAPVTIVNNGHTIQANYGTAGGGTMVRDGQEYQLLQFHFHRPSEHTINGKSYPMEMHLVHKSAQGGLSVLGVLLDTGAASHALDTFWSRLPKTESEQLKLDHFDVASLLPSDLTTYRYAGSLTTPPCSEGVAWNLLKSPVSASAEQVTAFRQIIEYNNRWTQPINGRDVLEDAGLDS